jgi:hypothetical protein
MVLVKYFLVERRRMERIRGIFTILASFSRSGGSFNMYRMFAAIPWLAWLRCFASSRKFSTPQGASSSRDGVHIQKHAYLGTLPVPSHQERAVREVGWISRQGIRQSSTDKKQ